MKAIRINTTIDPSILRFDEVKGFKGKKAEIIILIDDNDENPISKDYGAAGALSKYADTQKVAEENSAYEKHIKSKYGNH